MDKKLRVGFYILGAEPFYQSVETPEEANIAINSIANFALFAVDNGFMPDHSNFADLEEYDEADGEWYTWHDEDGYDIQEWAENRKSLV